MGRPSRGIVGACRAVAVFLAVTVAPAANAAVFSFSALANEGEAFWDAKATDPTAAGGSFDGVTDIWTIGGIGVKATASGSTSPASRAYLDAGNAGLGVCSSSSCAGSSDDNTGIVGGGTGAGTSEVLTLTFSQEPRRSALTQLHSAIGAMSCSRAASC